LSVDNLNAEDLEGLNQVVTFLETQLENFTQNFKLPKMSPYTSKLREFFNKISQHTSGEKLKAACAFIRTIRSFTVVPDNVDFNLVMKVTTESITSFDMVFND